MEYRELGSTGLTVSEIGFGPEWMKDGPEETKEVTETLRLAGVNILDCWMSDPEIRDNLGYAIAGHTDQWIIQGHIGSTWQDGQYVRSRKRPEIEAAFNDQLERLGVDSVAIGMMHYIDSVEEFRQCIEGEFYAYVQELKAAGRIKHVGLSTHNPDVGIEAVKSGVVEVIMFSINPAFDMMPASDDLDTLFGDLEAAGEGIDPKRAELYGLCEAAGVGITVMKPYAGGRLLSAEASPFGVALSPAQCIHYCLTRPAVASVLCGYKDVEEARQALAYEDAPAEARDYASIIASAPKHAYFGQCTYCGHCQPCVAGIDIATVNKFADLALMQDTVPESIRAHYEALSANASDCIGCHACEPRCPFGVPIAERMEETVQLFSSAS